MFLLKLLREETGAEIVVAFDPPGLTSRHKVFASYKAQRKPMPDDLVSQIPLIHELVEVLGVRGVQKEGWEADDVIATLARRAVEAGKSIVIHSGDKDILQLVRPGVRVIVPRKETDMDPEEVKKRWGVGPEKIVELLALMGDASDNLPGVPGVGEKTAASLLGRFGSLDELYSRLAEVASEKLRGKLEECREQVLQTRELARLKDDLELEEGGGAKRDPERVRQLFARLEFSRLSLPEPAQEVLQVKASFLSAGAAPEELSEPSASLRKALEASSRVVCVLTDDGLALDAGGKRWLVPAAARGLEKFWKDPGIRKITFGAKELCRVLLPAQASPGGLDIDLQLAAHLVCGREMALPEMVRAFLGVDSAPEEGEVPACRAGRCLDAAGALVPILEERLRETGMADLLRDVEMPLAPVLAEMELAGIRLDRERLAEVSAGMRGKLADLGAEIERLVGGSFNPLSPRQVGEILFRKLGLPSGRKTKTGFSTDEDVLQDLAILHPVPARILEYRKLAKLLGTYLEALPGYCDEDGILRTTFHQMGAATGRLSSSDPNLQNIPARGETGTRIRSAFVPRTAGGLLISADYSQIELRILAHVSGDAAFLDSFEKGEDIHAATAAEMFGKRAQDVAPDERRAAKAVNFGIVYGMTAFGLARELKCPPARAKEYLDRFFGKHPAVKSYWDDTLKAARGQGWVRTLLGRRRLIPEAGSPVRSRREEAEREALNHPIQGTAADCIKLAMIRVRARVPEARLLLTIHDELLFEAPGGRAQELAREIAGVMEKVMDLKAPLSVRTACGASWAQCH